MRHECYAVGGEWYCNTCRGRLMSLAEMIAHVVRMQWTA